MNWFLQILVLMFTPTPCHDIAWSEHLKPVSRAGQRTADVDAMFEAALKNISRECNMFQRVVLFLSNIREFDRFYHDDAEIRLTPCSLAGLDVDSLVDSVRLLVLEAVHHCRRDPPDDWPSAAYDVIGRNDLSQQRSSRSANYKAEQSLLHESATGDDGMDWIDSDVG